MSFFLSVYVQIQAAAKRKTLKITATNKICSKLRAWHAHPLPRPPRPVGAMGDATDLNDNSPVAAAGWKDGAGAKRSRAEVLSSSRLALPDEFGWA